jgi:hypothetical protein
MQTIFVAAPGIQSIDAWLPLALELKRQREGEVVIVFPYLWVLELASENDTLLRIITDNEFMVVCKLFPFSFYVLFKSFADLMRYVRMIQYFKNAIKFRSLDNFSFHHRIRLLLRGLGSWNCILTIRFFRFSPRGVMIWDILNLNPEPYRSLQSLILKTKLWKRISVNVAPIYIEDVAPNVLNATKFDYQLSHSEQQTKSMIQQYGFTRSQIIETCVPKFDQEWINYLESFSLHDYKSFSPYVLLVSRGADPPLLESVQRLGILEEVIYQICEVRSMSLLVKLHPNECQSSFDHDIAEVSKRRFVSEDALSRIKLVHDHVIVAAKYAQFGLAYYSSTVADMVRVGCPAIQVLPLFDTDCVNLRLEKQMFDYGFVELVHSVSSLSATLDDIDLRRDTFIAFQRESWSNYFVFDMKFKVKSMLFD